MNLTHLCFLMLQRHQFLNKNVFVSSLRFVFNFQLLLFSVQLKILALQLLRQLRHVLVLLHHLGVPANIVKVSFGLLVFLFFIITIDERAKLLGLFLLHFSLFSLQILASLLVIEEHVLPELFLFFVYSFHVLVNSVVDFSAFKCIFISDFKFNIISAVADGLAAATGILERSTMRDS